MRDENNRRERDLMILMSEMRDIRSIYEFLRDEVVRGWRDFGKKLAGWRDWGTPIVDPKGRALI